MSEYSEAYSISKLIGSSPGYVGYDERISALEKIRKHPYSVILLDEIDKAHPDILSLFLGAFENGFITDASGRKISFRNSYIIMTSNLGSQELIQNKNIGFAYSKGKNNIRQNLKKQFKEEFINRIDEIITFNSLTKEDFVRIAKIMLSELCSSLAEKGICFEYTDEVVNLLSEKSYSVKYGARNLRRTIQTEIEDKASVKAGIKAGLEGLKGVVPGLVDIVVNIEGLASSNADLMLDSTFESEAALKAYAVHPSHVEVADRDVRPYTQTRLCLDFEM
jgi:ATP-dependent Clp protease ATP-binding subunit ClpA